MRRVLVEQLPALGEPFLLDAGASHHLLHVIRVARGTVLAVADGHGRSGTARLAGVEAGRAVLELTAADVAPPQPARVVLLGLPRAALAEEALTLATEAGATAFLLVVAERSPPGLPRSERVERVLRAAVSQCGRATVPSVDGPMTLDAALDGRCPGARWVCTPGAEPLGGADGDATLAIGPEGGWGDAERERFVRAGFSPAGLGPHVLRAPTAVAVALGRLSGPIGS